MVANGPILEAIKISKMFGEKQVLEDISLKISPGETLTVLGPSGSGKTTLLRILAGLEEPTQGSVIAQGRDITDLPPERRDIGFVFQHYALFPHMSVSDNLAFPLKLRRVPKKEIVERVTEALETINMLQFRRRKPARLSGGEKQRVALMRSVIFRPPILLLDEPFSALDQYLIEKLQEDLWLLRDRLRIAMVLITHDSPFALSISNQILVLHEGRVEQIGTPRSVFEQPTSKFVAEFFGTINYINGRLVETYGNELGRVRINQGLEVEAILSVPMSLQNVVIAVRPNCIKVSRTDTGLVQGLRGTVKALQYRGTTVRVQITVDQCPDLQAELNAPEANQLCEGEIVFLHWDKNDASILLK